MAQFTDIDLVPGFGPIQTAISALKALSETLSTVLEPVAAAVDALSVVLEVASEQTFDFDIAGVFLSEVLTVHLYPAQPYQAMRYKQWSEVAQRSLQLSRTCFDPPYEVLVFLLRSGTTIADLIDQSNALLDVWGRPFTGIDDSPGNVSIDRTLRRVQTGECRTLANDLPWLGDMVGLLNSQLVLSVENPVSGLASAIAEKIDDLAERVAAIQAAVDVLGSFDLPTVKYTRFAVNSLDDVNSTLRQALNAPGSQEYVAGTVMLANTATATVIETLLGA